MKELKYILLVLLLFPFFAFTVSAEQIDYKAGYEKQLQQCADTQKTIDGVVQWLKDHNYEKYPVAKQTVEDALDQASYGEDAKKKAEDFAVKGDWKKAYGWVNQYYQYQIKVATQGLLAKKMVEDAEAEAAR